MSVDKLVDSTQLDSDLTSVANAIRTKGGTSASLAFPADFVSAIGAIPSGGGGTPVWNRPSDWPDIDQLDISGGNIIYMTYLADENVGFCDITCKTSSGQYTVEVGTISGSTFTADTTYNVNSNMACQHYFGSALGGYKVIRVTGNLTSLNVYRYSALVSYDGQYRFAERQGILEVRGKATGLTSVNFYNGAGQMQRCYLYGANLTGSMQSVFRCASLVLCELPYCITASTTSFQWMFYGANSLKYVDMTGWDTGNVTSMDSMFYDCNNLEEIDLSALDTSSVTTLNGMFNNCRTMTNVNLSGWDVKKVTTMANMFTGCGSLSSLNLTGWSTDDVTALNSMFYGCGRLREVNVSGFKTNKVTTVDQMFRNCGLLYGVDISEWDMGLVTATGGFLQGCQNAGPSLTIPSTLTTIGANAFNAARSILEFHFLRTTPPTLDNTNAFSNMTDGGGKKIYVPYSADHSVLNAYKTASNWSTYASYIYEEAAP